MEGRGRKTTSLNKGVTLVEAVEMGLFSAVSLCCA